MTVLLAVFALVLATTGFAGLALAMNKHHRDVFGRMPTRGRKQLLQAISCGLLVLSLASCIGAWRISQGITGWFGLATVAVAVVALGLTYLPRVRAR